MLPYGSVLTARREYPCGRKRVAYSFTEPMTMPVTKYFCRKG